MKKLGRLGILGRLGKKLKVSVIIPTYNRDEPLRRTLESLFRQDYPDFEIIVVDQSTKKFPEKEAFLEKYKSKIRLFHLSIPSLPRARNFGISKAKGEIVLFCDDDVKVKKGWISAHANNYLDPKIGAVTGRVVTLGQKIEPNYRKVGKIFPWGTISGGFSSTIRQEVGNVVGCNFSWRKEILEKVGRFDENFIGNALREETDLALRIKKAGWKIIFEPRAELTHIFYQQGGCRKDENRLGWYHDFFHNETYFFLKHIKWYWWKLFWLTRWQFFVRCMFGFGREVSLRSIIIPWQGIYHGWQTYRRKKNANRS